VVGLYTESGYLGEREKEANFEVEILRCFWCFRKICPMLCLDIVVRVGRTFDTVWVRCCFFFFLLQYTWFLLNWIGDLGHLLYSVCSLYRF
jgi:hypothetical protein